MSDRRDWDILLIGGASGVGKTRVSYPLARHFAVGITEIDDFQVILEHMTTPEQQPVIHLFNQDPDAWWRMDDAVKLAHAISYATVMVEPLTYVIANHLEGGPPIVLEGDFLHPALAARAEYSGIPSERRVRGFILYEEDEAQIAANFLAREGEPQPERAGDSWRYSEWLRQEAARLGVPTLPARPWDNVFERAVRLIESGVKSGADRLP